MFAVTVSVCYIVLQRMEPKMWGLWDVVALSYVVFMVDVLPFLFLLEIFCQIKDGKDFSTIPFPLQIKQSFAKIET